MLAQPLIDLYHFIGMNAAAILLWSAIIGSAYLVLAMIVEIFHTWRQHVEHQADQKRVENLRRVAESHPWPTRPGPKGGPWRGGRAA